MRHRGSFITVAALACAMAGCLNGTPLDGQPDAEETSEAVDQQPAEGKEDVRRPAQVGVGVRGRSLEDETGVGRVIAQPAVAYFRTKEKLVFEIQLPQAMQLYQATTGEPPQSHDEFMEKIVKANMIKLPDLPEGQEYVYDPEQGQLMVQGARR